MYKNVFVSLVYVYHMHKYLQRPKKALNFLELEFQMFVSCCVGDGNQTWVLCKSTKYS